MNEVTHILRSIQKVVPKSAEALAMRRSLIENARRRLAKTRIWAFTRTWLYQAMTAGLLFGRIAH